MTKILISFAGIATLTLFASTVVAAPTYTVPVYSQVINYDTSQKDSIACRSLGDVVSCSAPLLNYFYGMPTNTALPTGYVIDTPQGELDKGYIVIDAGGNSTINTDTVPTVSNVENSYFANTQGKNYFMTGEAEKQGGTNDPTDGSIAAGDSPYSWDVGINWLMDALTIDGTRRDMIIGFDFNQPQNNDNLSASLDVWALITVRDLQDETRNQSFELRGDMIGVGTWATFSTDKTFTGTGNTTPKSKDFTTVVSAVCVRGQPGDANFDYKLVPEQVTSCPAGYTIVKNAQSTSSTEFINFIPELNDKLEWYDGNGFDVISVQLRMGCFGGTDSKDGPTLADGNPTTHCDAGGYGDVFLMAGAEERNVPEPAALLLVSLGLLGIASIRQRIKQ